MKIECPLCRGDGTIDEFDPDFWDVDRWRSDPDKRSKEITLDGVVKTSVVCAHLGKGWMRVLVDDENGSANISEGKLTEETLYGRVEIVDKG